MQLLYVRHSALRTPGRIDPSSLRRVLPFPLLPGVSGSRNSTNDTSLIPSMDIVHNSNPDFPHGLPTIPNIEDDEVRQQVFRHRSYFIRSANVFEDSQDTPLPDNESLEFLGDSVLSLVTASLVRDMHPRLRVGSYSKIRSLIVSNKNLADLCRLYKLTDNLAGAPGQIMALRSSGHVQADLFEAYVGGLYQTKGLEVVTHWLWPLFRPYVDEAYLAIKAESQGNTYVKQQGSPPLTPLYQSAQDVGTSNGSTSGQPLSGPIHVIQAPPSPESGHLSFFNQWCAQNSKTPQWVFKDVVGTKTTPMWPVELQIDNAPSAVGLGNTKKAAKNDAAKKALQSLGLL